MRTENKYVKSTQSVRRNNNVQIQIQIVKFLRFMASKNNEKKETLMQFSILSTLLFIISSFFFVDSENGENAVLAHVRLKMSVRKDSKKKIIMG